MMKLSEKLRDMADKPYKEADRFRLRQAANEIDRLQAIMDGLPLAKQNLVDHEYIAVGPLLPLRLLMTNPERQQ